MTDQILERELARAPRRLIQGLWRRLWAVEAVVWVLLLAIPMGVLLVFFIPPFQGLDEGNHFLRAYTISEGSVFAVDHQGRTGGYVSECVAQYVKNFNVIAEQPGPYRRQQFFSQPPGCSSNARVFVPFENSALYSPVSYAPQVIGLAVARGVGASLPVQYYVGRLAILLVYVALMVAALRIALVGRTVIGLVAVWPMSLLLAATYSADTMTIGLATLFVAAVLRSLVIEEPSWPVFGVACASVVLLALSKSTYFLLAPLILLVPWRPFGTLWKSAAVKVGVLVAAVLVAGAWYLKVKYISLAPWFPPGYIDPARQVSQILHHPRWFAGFMLQNFTETPSAAVTWQTFVAQISFFRNPARGSGFPPPWILVIGYSLFVAAYLREATGLARWSWSAVARGALPILLVAVNVVVIFTAGYVEWTGPGAPPIIGGRYFLPLMAVPLISLVILAKVRLGRAWSMLPLVPFVVILYSWLILRGGHLFY